MASEFDGKIEGFEWRYLRDKGGKIRKDKKGRELKSYTWRYRDPAGASRQVTRRKIEDLRAKRDEIRDQLNKHAYVDPRRAEVTLRVYAASWLANRKALVGHNTWDSYQRYLNLAILPQLGDYRLCDLDATVLETFVCGLRGTKTRRGTTITSSTVKQYWTCLSMIIQDAINKGILVLDPRNGVNKGKWDWAKKRYPFAPEDMTAIETAAYDHSDFMGCLVTLAKETGLRIGEIMGLCEDQFDFTRGREVLHVDRQLCQDADKRWILADPKSTSSVRDVPLSIAAVKAARTLLDAQPQEARTHTMPRKIGDKTAKDVTVRLVFAKDDGSPTTTPAVTGRWRKIVKTAGVYRDGDENGIHRVRHTFAGNLIASGVDIYVVSKMLGHRSIQVTEMFYAHLRREVIDTVRTVLNGGATNATRPTVTSLRATKYAVRFGRINMPNVTPLRRAA